MQAASLCWLVFDDTVLILIIGVNIYSMENSRKNRHKIYRKQEKNTE